MLEDPAGGFEREVSGTGSQQTVDRFQAGLVDVRVLKANREINRLKRAHGKHRKVGGRRKIDVAGGGAPLRLRRKALIERLLLELTISDGILEAAALFGFLPQPFRSRLFGAAAPVGRVLPGR